MSDWLQQLSELEQQATPGEWKVVGRNYVIEGFPQVELPTENQHYFPVNYPEDADLIVALRNSATDLISRARRAEELEQAYEDLLRDHRASEAQLLQEFGVGDDENKAMREIDELAQKYLGKSLDESEDA